MSQTEQILDRFVEQQGWTRGTVLDLLTTYIDNQDDPATFEDYLTSLADVDAEMEPDEGEDEVIDMGLDDHENDDNEENDR